MKIPMVEKESRPYTVQQVYKIVAGGDPAVEKDLRKVERALRKTAIDTNKSTSIDISFSQQLQNLDPVVVFEELNDLTPVEALERAIAKEQEEIIVFPAESTESTESKTPLADKYFSDWYEQKLKQEVHEKRQRVSQTRRKTITKPEKQKSIETIKKRVPKEKPLPPSNFMTIQDLLPETGVAKYTLRNILRAGTEKIKIGRSEYFNREQALGQVETYKREKAKKKASAQLRRQLANERREETRCNESLNSELSSKSAIYRHYEGRREGLREFIREKAQQSQSLEQVGQSIKKISGPALPDGYIKTVQLAERFHMTTHQVRYRLASLGGIKRGQDRCFQEDEAVALLEAKLDEEKKQLEKKREFEKKQRPQGMSMAQISKRFDLNYKTIAKIFTDTPKTKWRSGLIIDENVAIELVTEYLRTRPNDKGIYTRENQQFVSYNYFNDKYGFDYETLEKDLKGLSIANEPGVGGIQLVSLSEALSRLAPRINTPVLEKITGIYTDKDKEQWTTKFGFKKKYGIKHQTFTKISEGLETILVRGHNGQVVQAFKISEVVQRYQNNIIHRRRNTPGKS